MDRIDREMVGGFAGKARCLRIGTFGDMVDCNRVGNKALNRIFGKLEGSKE